MYYNCNAQAEEGEWLQLPQYCVYHRFTQCELLRNVTSIVGNWLIYITLKYTQTTKDIAIQTGIPVQFPGTGRAPFEDDIFAESGTNSLAFINTVGMQRCTV